MYSNQKSRVLALLMALVMIFQFVVATPYTAFAEETEASAPVENSEAKIELVEEERPVLKAAIPQPSGTVLCFTSDTHNKSGNVAATRLGDWLDKVSAKYGGVTLMAFGGDMANASASQSEFWTLTQADMDQLNSRSVTGVYTTGNHEYSPGSYSNGMNNTTKQYVEDVQGAEGSNYRLYCLGSAGGNWNNYSSSQITKLTNYLNSVDNSKPIIIITHYPLHQNSYRTISGASDVIDVLNNAVASGKKIVYLWGHNHTDSDQNYDQIFLPGSEITYSSGNKKTVNFYYGAAGCMSDSEYGTGSASVKGKGLVLTIDNNNKLTFEYYDANLNAVTEGGTVTEKDPVAVTGVTVSPATATVLERKTVQLRAVIAPSDATNTNVRWSSSNTSIATVDNNGLVRGVAEGSVTITATTVDGNFSAESRVTVTHNDDASVEEEISITPSTSNPEESISIQAGDTLVIKVTNGSSNSAYDFTASLGNSGIAQIQGNSTVNIAAGATEEFTVVGLADGKVDITIQNSNSYGSQYARKGTIHLTVGEGGSTPVDPPVGDTVSITPTTDNPEESIKINVGDTLTINVTNGSSNSAYDFTASLSNSGIAQIQGNSTVNIAAGATGQFTVEGLADGTVDITIQNSNSYGSQYARKGTIHLTVGEGGSTPVDPPVGDTVSITPSTSNPEESIKINVGDTLTINVTNGSSNSGYDYTLSLSNSGIAQIQGNSTVNIAAGATGQFTVKGLANGTVDITIQNNQSSSQYVRKGTIHLTVGEGGSTPVDPPVGDTVSITPTTDNPEESIKINVGDTLTINVTNGSSNSGYDFTASLSNSGVAQIQGNSTVNIAAGATSQFTVKGLAEGTVDITIQNENSYGSQYVRKGIIHLTVGEGGSTPVDPPVGDTVMYRLATSLEADKEYIIVNGNSGNVYVVSNEAGSSRQLKGIAATVSDDTITLSAENAAKAAFTAKSNSNSTANGFWLMNGSQYLYADSSNGLRLVAGSTQTGSSNNAKSWHYKADNKNLLWFFKDANSSDGYTDTSSTYKYYLECSNGVFTDNHADSTSLANTSTPAIYLFVEDEGSAPQPHTHTYGEPTWSWTNDYSKATATFKCTANDDTQTVTDNAPATVEVTAAGCTTDKVVRYTAKVTFNGTEYTDSTANITVPNSATGHDWSDAEYTWSDDFSSVTASATCKNDASHVETETVTTTSERTKEATCETRGETTYKAVFTKDAFATQTMTADDIPALGHDFGNWTVSKAATCTEKGEETRHCSRCDETETRETEALGHDFGDWAVTKAATCTEKGEETRECSRCDAKETREVEALGHALEHHEAQAATCTENGWKAYDSCARCDYTTFIEIPALGHDWSEPEYIWADDYSSVTAKAVCARDPEHVIEETVEPTSEVIKEATIDEEGEMLYTADFEDDMFTKQTIVVEIPKEPTYEISFKQFANTSGGIIVQWNAVEDPEFKNYTLYRSEAGKNKWVLVKENFTETKVTDDDLDALKSGTYYDYRLVVTEADGDSYDGIHKDWYYLGVTTMNAPTCTRAGIRVTWPKVEGATKYVVMRSIGAGAPDWKYLTTVSATEDDLQRLDTKAGESGSWYAYTVRAVFVDEDGNETYGGQPGGRSILYRAPVQVVKAISVSKGVRVTFKTVKAGYTYRLYRSVKTSSGWSSYEKVTDLVKVYKGVDEEVWIYDETAENGQTYKYYVRCISKDGAVPLSSYDNELQITYKKP